MKPHVRAQLFCAALLVAPFLYALGDKLAGLGGAIALFVLPLVATAIYASLGGGLGGGKPPFGTPPA
jgi:hypothetical protein